MIQKADKSNLELRATCLAVLALTVAGCSSSKTRSIDDLTHFPAISVSSLMSSRCAKPPCEFTNGGRKWKLSSQFSSGSFQVPFRQQATRLMGPEGQAMLFTTERVNDRDRASNGGWSVPVSANEHLINLWTSDTPCVERGDCGTWALLRDSTLLAAGYGICYVPKSTAHGGGVLTESVKPEVIQGAWKEQVAHLPSLAKSVTVPESFASGTEDYYGTIQASYDEHELFAAGFHVTTMKGLTGVQYVGCINAYYIARVAGLTDRLFAYYDEQLTANAKGAAEKVKQDKAAEDAWKRMTIPK